MTQATASKVVSVRLRHRGQFYDFDPGGLELRPGDWVIVETGRGQDIGQVVMSRQLPPEEAPADLKPVIRLANAADFSRQERSRERESEALALARAKAAEAGLPMRLVAAEYTYNGRSLTLYFTAEKRVDFRELVKELARELRTRIELRQIGARDEARLLGGIGSCGRPLCCATFLHDFLRISVRMAKEQDLPLSPMKIAGVCGRLLCCLSYECDQYRDIKAHLPGVGDQVATLRGRGRVTAMSVPKETVTVEIRPGVTVEVTAEELAQATRLEAEGHLPAGSPIYLPQFEEVAEGVEERAEPPADVPSAEDVEKRGRRRRRRRRKTEKPAPLALPKQVVPSASERSKPPQQPPRPTPRKPPAPEPAQAAPEARRRRRPRRRPPQKPTPRDS